jgi:hypothetical protein
MEMKRVDLLSLVMSIAGAAALLSACLVESEQPLNHPGENAIDPRLLGDWVVAGDDPSERGGGLLFLSSGGQAMLAIAYGPDRSFEEVFEAHAAEIGATTWLSIRRPEFREGRHEVEASTGSYLLAGYEIEDTRLSIRLLDPAAISELIRNEELPGRPSDGALSTAILTATTEELRTFLIGHPGLDLLSEAMVELRRRQLGGCQ